MKRKRDLKMADKWKDKEKGYKRKMKRNVLKKWQTDYINIKTKDD